MLIKSVVLVATLFAGSLASDVLEIGDDDFNTRVAETETTLVMFYAPWYVFISKIFIISVHFFAFCNRWNLYLVKVRLNQCSICYAQAFLYSKRFGNYIRICLCVSTDNK